MVQMRSILEVADNSGAKRISMILPLGGHTGLRAGLGDVITAAGVSAGIDMALHLVARLHSVERAKEVRRGIQYDPKPPV